MSMIVIGDRGGSSSRRQLSEISEEETVRVSVDLVAAARWNLRFLNIVTEEEFHWLHHTPTIIEAIRRYDELWMPLISDLNVGLDALVILPPLDIEWVWYCHTLNPASYRQYCESKFSKLIAKPTIFNKENEEYALDRCRDIWIQRFPHEPFENQLDSDETTPCAKYEDLLSQVLRLKNLYEKLVEPYMYETVYLIAARNRYKRFLYFLQRYADGCARFVPASDILLVWLSHQAYPTVYAADLKEIKNILGKVITVWEEAKEEEVEESKNLWERVFEQPYIKAGGTIIQGSFKIKPPIYWEVTEEDVNTRYKSMLPRFLLEICVFVKLDSKSQMIQAKKPCEFWRLRMVRCHKELKIDIPISTFALNTWQKAWHLYCEFRTKGLMIEIRNCGRFLKRSFLKDSITLLWNDLLRATPLSVEREVEERVRFISSITPPAQAAYLLKCVPDRVTDDSGAMISDVILRMNQYRPQEGRWLSRTVLDHAGRECFVVRMRVAGGLWRRGDEAPSAVKWEERIIEIREGSWSYVGGSIGRAPLKVVGTAKAQEPDDQWDVSWKFSNGYILMIRWQSSSSMSATDPCFHLMDETTPNTNVKLVTGRKMQYQKQNNILKNGKQNKTTKEKKLLDNEEDEEEGFITLIRFSGENPTGKATALLNWKLLVVEFLPEEDAVFVLLLCITILKSVSEMRKKDIGGLLIRRRLKEPQLGARDWGSVTLHPSSCSPSISSVHLQPWYWNPGAVMVCDDSTRQLVAINSQAEGGDALYKQWIFN